ncbi:MAG: DUF4037 domain-containing protein [Oscillospiraceae bacterium]|nr:DUF4037 domain-containing protein [Oscillospiraceae bacterium]
MLHERFPQYEGRIAVGLAGRGSECFGFDDEVSRDHDFETGFCLWLEDIDDLRIGVELARAYRALPGSGAAQRSSMGEERLGVRRTGFFYRRYTGTAGAPESWQQWLYLPSHALAEATNGEVWRDDLGRFSAVREAILHGMPEDVRRKKLAARAVEMAQAGQYNYGRCLRHGEEGAAMLAAAEFVRAACGMIYLLNRRHMPYYKWMLRGMDGLPQLGQLRPALEFILTAENDEAGRQTKTGVIEDVCAAVIRQLRAEGLSHGDWDYLEPHAFAVMDTIENPEIRALHIMEG